MSYRKFIIKNNLYGWIPMIKKTTTVQDIIDAIETLDLTDKEILMEVFSKHLKEHRRKELFKAFEQARQAYDQGEVSVVKVADLLAELLNSKTSTT
jgi:5'-deoxynucleotidase YfbR-like HD superfamily hydrolase